MLISLFTFMLFMLYFYCLYSQKILLLMFGEIFRYWLTSRMKMMQRM